MRKSLDGTVTVARLKELLVYSPEDGEFRWRQARNMHGGRKPAGTPAGRISRGYVQIGIDGRRYLAHRLAWLYMTGGWPDEVDHINLDRADNRWANLRNGSHTDNCRNVGKRKNNKSGYVGVSWPKKQRQWTAHIMANRESIYLGSFDNPALASAVRNWAAEMLHGEFARAA